MEEIEISRMTEIFHATADSVKQLLDMDINLIEDVVYHRNELCIALGLLDIDANRLWN